MPTTDVGDPSGRSGGPTPGGPVPATSPVPPGAAARFSVIRLIARGGMGTVFLVRDSVLEREVALKVLHNPERSGLGALKAEFRRAADVTHPNVVQLHDLFAEGATAWFTMEHVDGVPFDAAIRRGARLGERLGAERALVLLRALAQLVDGLRTLHAHGLIHRDVKPGNVLVTPEGRVVLLDFGVSTPAAPLGSSTDASSVAGTIAYMAPEQLGGSPSVASDAYSVGVLVYETVFGSLPRPPRTWDPTPAPPLPAYPPWVPDRVAAALLSLLAPDPTARATLDDLAALLLEAEGVRGPVPTSPGLLPVFVGREAPLGRLEAARRAVQGGRATVVDLSGPSGVGKSELALQLYRRATSEGALVLRGRCHPHENVPFRGVDAVLDRLAQYLTRLDPAECARLAPVGRPSLTSVFPVFTHVPGFAEAAPLRPGRRVDAFRALRELFDRLTATREVILGIDDIQWADDDSAELIDVLLAKPAPRLLFVAISRSEDANAPAVEWFRRLCGEPGRFATERLTLAPLSRDDSLEYLHRALPLNARGANLERLADESGGSPLFLAQLASHPGGVAAGATLEEVVRGRVEQLPEAERKLVAAVCVHEAPLLLVDALAAARLDAGAADAASRLVRRCLFRIVDTPDGRALAPYHGRITEAVQAGMAPLERRDWHSRLADVLLPTRAGEPERIFRHLDSAGRPGEARVYAEQAALDADARLAFRRAAELYQLCIERGWDDGDGRLRLRLADALANAGDAGRAAALFRAQAEGAQGVRRSELRARAVGQDLNAGNLEPGVRELRAVLGELGVRLPEARLLAVVWAVLYRLLLWRRGLAFAPVPEATLSPEARLRLDLLWFASVSLAVTNHLVSDAAGARGAWDALQAGEPRRVARALAFKAGADAFLLGWRGHDAALETLRTAQAIAAEHGSVLDRDYCAAVEGTVRWARGEWRLCTRAFDAVLGQGTPTREVMPAGPTSAYSFLYSGVAHTGDIRRLLKEVPPLADEYRATGDRLGRSVCLLGQPSLAFLYLGRATELAEASERLLAEWPADSFLTPHYHAMITSASISLYLGRPEEALEGLDRRWSAFARSGIPFIPVIAAEMDFLRGRCALLVARRSVDAASRSRAARTHLACLRRLEGNRVAWARPLAALLRRPADGSGASGWDGPGVREAEEAGLPHLAAAFAGDDRGLAWLTDQGVAEPERCLTMLGLGPTTAA